MGKRVVGKKYRLEGRQSRLFTIIECDACGKLTYERKDIQAALNRKCRGCPASKQVRPSVRQYDGRTKHPLYGTWTAMKQRCYNPNNKNYKYYGAKGIRVCDEWLNDFWSFVSCMGKRPKNHTLDRIDNDKGYSPDNVVWALPIKQIHNRSVKRQSTYEKRKRQREYSKDYHSKHYQRRQLGWWRENFGLYNNPYIYGAMPYRKTSLAARRKEAIERGWYVPMKNRKK